MSYQLPQRLVAVPQSAANSQRPSAIRTHSTAAVPVRRMLSVGSWWRASGQLYRTPGTHCAYIGPPDARGPCAVSTTIEAQHGATNLPALASEWSHAVRTAGQACPVQVCRRRSAGGAPFSIQTQHRGVHLHGLQRGALRLLRKVHDAPCVVDLHRQGRAALSPAPPFSAFHIEE